MGFANVRAGTRYISESHSEISTRVPFCIEGVLVTGPGEADTDAALV